MTRPHREPVPADGGVMAPASLSSRIVLWSGAVACVAGMAVHGLWQQWAGGRFVELLVLGVISLGIAWPLQRLARCSWASALALVWLAALMLFVRPVPLLATVLFGVSALALGSLLARTLPMALRCAIGLALSAGVLGWLLPLPIHFRWTYALTCIALVVAARATLKTDLQIVQTRWHEAVSAHPTLAALGILALGLASTGCWLPTMQFDDLAYHVGLPWQLMETGRYALDPSHQVWTLAAWAADVQQAVPQVLAAAEARGALNAVWLAITAAGVWQLCIALRGSVADAWVAVALYASLPLTAGLAAGMQTETATAGLVVWLAWMSVRCSALSQPEVWRAGALLLGGLMGLKLMAALYALVLLGWAATRRPQLPHSRLWLTCAALVAVTGLSSYVYAAWIAGNPFLPLANAWFDSPFYPHANFEDPRWQAGMTPLLPWHLTFRTQAYFEGFAGAAGFAPVALAGAWVLALASRGLRAVAIVASLMFCLALLPMQYLRYAFPAMVLLVPVLVIATRRAAPARGQALLAAVIALGFAFQANANWMQRTGALKLTVLAPGDTQPVLEKYAPERLLAMRMRQAGSNSTVLVMDATNPRYAEFGERGRTTAWYDPRMMRDAATADLAPDGHLWRALWLREGITDLLVRPAQSTPARSAALQRAGATRRAQAGDVEWWQLPAGRTP